MMDDMDRECCAEIERAVMDGLKLTPRWRVVRRDMIDPHIYLTLHHEMHRKPQVKIKIVYEAGEDE